MWSAVVAGSDLLDSQTTLVSFANPTLRQNTNLRTNAYAHAMSLPSWQVSRQLLPGDLLVCVDAVDPMSWSTVGGVTTYLRQATELSLVVLRHPQVTMASLACYNSQVLRQSTFGLTTAADHIWKSLFLANKTTTLTIPSSRPQMTQYRPTMAPMNAFLTLTGCETLVSMIRSSISISSACRCIR